MEKTDLSEMKKEEFETIAEILHQEGLPGLHEHLKEERSLLHRRYIFLLSLLFTIGLCAVLEMRQRRHREINEHVEAFAIIMNEQNVCFRDSLQLFVDTTLNYEPKKYK